MRVCRGRWHLTKSSPLSVVLVAAASVLAGSEAARAAHGNPGAMGEPTLQTAGPAKYANGEPRRLAAVTRKL